MLIVSASALFIDVDSGPMAKIQHFYLVLIQQSKLLFTLST